MATSTKSRKRTPKLVRVDAPPPIVGRGRKAAPKPKIPSSALGRWLYAIREVNDGEWYVYPDRVPTGVSTRINQGKAYDLKAGEFETATRGQKDARNVLYVRYIGSKAKK